MAETERRIEESLCTEGWSRIMEPAAGLMSPKITINAIKLLS
jgi:hypothetical protein